MKVIPEPTSSVPDEGWAPVIQVKYNKTSHQRFYIDIGFSAISWRNMFLLLYFRFDYDLIQP
jgi:hypothetical protein